MIGIERKARHQRQHSATEQRPLCGYAQVLPDFVTSLVVTFTYTGKVVARTRNLERGHVRDELHRLKALFPESAGYEVRAIVTEVTEVTEVSEGSEA